LRKKSKDKIEVNNQTVTIPQVGMGATQCVGSDRRAYTVVEIINDRKIVLQRDKVKRIDSNGFSTEQKYSYEPNPNGHEVVVTLRKNGRWCEVGEAIDNGVQYVVGHRKEYDDPHF